MYISEATYEALNDFLGLCFQMNSYCDNIAYNLGYKKMVVTEPIFHEKFAHVFPALADVISELMLNMEARPIRKALEADTYEYENNESMFSDLKTNIDKYRQEILRVIEIADFNNDFEIKIDMEEFLSNFKKYLDQVNTWNLKAMLYGEDVKKFDKDFPAFTTI